MPRALIPRVPLNFTGVAACSIFRAFRFIPTATLGRNERGPVAIEAIRKHKAVYLMAVGGAAYLVAAFASGDFARLSQVAGDFVHEPYRLPQIPGGGEAIAAGVAAGAWTGWLSGSGSSVLCVCEREKAGLVQKAMAAAFSRASMPSEARILSADNEGLTVEG